MNRSTAEDRAVKSQSPPGVLAALMRPLVDEIEATVKAAFSQNPFQRDPTVVRLMLPVIKGVNRYFSAEIRGWQNLPKRGPMLIVGNHSGGAQTIDVVPLLERWIEDRGPETPIYMLGYDLLFAFPIVGPLGRKMGLLRANPALARQALQLGAAAVVFPGGDYEVFRSWSERNKIDFGGHKGFVELVLATRVPVVPMTIHGAHQSMIVLTRGQRIAQLMDLERLRVKVYPFIWNIPLGVTPAFVPSLQLPAKVTVQFGEPLDWSRFGPEKANDPNVVRKCYEQITGIMQQTLDALARERPYPILSRLNELRPSQILRGFLQSETDGAVGAARSRAEGTEPVLSPRAREKLRARHPSGPARGREVRTRPASAPRRYAGGAGKRTPAAG